MLTCEQWRFVENSDRDKSAQNILTVSMLAHSLYQACGRSAQSQKPESLLESILSKVSKRSNSTNVESLLMQVYDHGFRQQQQRRFGESALLEEHERRVPRLNKQEGDAEEAEEAEENPKKYGMTCTNCKNRDATAFMPSDDKRYIVCQKCGVAVSATAPKSSSFESFSRCTLDNKVHRSNGVAMLAHTSAIVADTMRVDATTQNDHARRRRQRDACGTSTPVPSSLRDAHLKMTRDATRETIRVDNGLSQQEVTKHDHVIIEIHRVLSQEGVPCDNSPVFDRVCQTFATLFTRGCVHSKLCQSDRCKAAFVHRSKRVIARECIRQVADSMTAEVERDQSCMSMTSVACKKIISKMSNGVRPYAKHNSSVAVKLEYEVLNECSSLELTSPCACSPTPGASHSKSMFHKSADAARIEILKISLSSAEKLDLAAPHVVSAARKALDTPLFFKWVLRTQDWSPDLLALALLLNAQSNTSDTRIKTLKETAERTSRKQRITESTFKRLLQDTPKVELETHPSTAPHAPHAPHSPHSLHVHEANGANRANRANGATAGGSTLWS